jgi:hypothetical protein
LLSKRRRCVETDDDKENNRLGVKGFRVRRRLEQEATMPLASIDVQSVSSVSGITDTETTAEENENENANALADNVATDGRGMSLTASAHPLTTAISTASLSSSNTNRSNGCLPFNCRKGMAQKSHRTPQQKAAFEAERTKLFKCKRIAYG